MDGQSSSAPVLAEIVEPVLQTHWEAIQSKREVLVEVFDRMSEGFPRERSKATFITEPVVLKKQKF